VNFANYGYFGVMDNENSYRHLGSGLMLVLRLGSSLQQGKGRREQELCGRGVAFLR